MEIPEAWWKVTCSVTNAPLACIAPNNKFIWVNSSFENLVGYSQAELQERTWIDITVQEDVGGDMASINQIISGKINQYSMAKRYRSKFGTIIPITLNVFRFPRNTSHAMICFIVEAIPDKTNQLELQELKDQLEQGIQNLEIRWKLLEEENKKGKVNVSYNSQHADNGGRNNNTSNSNAVIIAVAAVMGIMIIALATMLLGGKFNVQSNGLGTGEVSVEAPEK